MKAPGPVGAMLLTIAVEDLGDQYRVSGKWDTVGDISLAALLTVADWLSLQAAILSAAP